MRILSFEYQDADGWTLEPTKLDGFNLLVGLSGAGKTRIVRAIEQVFSAAIGEKSVGRLVHGGRFAVNFDDNGRSYRWQAALERGLPRGLQVHTEQIQESGDVLVQRTPEQFLLRGQTIPRLDRAQSAIAALKEDPAITPLYKAFSQCVFRTLDERSAHVMRDQADFELRRRRYTSVDDLGADFSLSLLDKAELLQDLFPDSLREVTEAFREAFPQVRKIQVVQADYRRHTTNAREALSYFAALVIEESGVGADILFDDLSSGMQRYLSFLIHLSFAPPGTVVLVDELESSFGINCLPAATRFLLRRAPDLQLILTSHHPYIIEQIPTACWKIVTRKGSHVRVLDASAIPALDESRSHLDRFTRLINLPEYTEGIQAA